MAINAGSEIELTLKMPSEITLGESMRVRCRGRVMRVVRPADNGWQGESSGESGSSSVDLKQAETSPAGARPTETKIGVAVCLSGYEYLPETDDGSADFRRISALHSSSESARPATSAPAGIVRDSVH
jgi:hypothetical protein